MFLNLVLIGFESSGGERSMTGKEEAQSTQTSGQKGG